MFSVSGRQWPVLLVLLSLLLVCSSRAESSGREDEVFRTQIDTLAPDELSDLLDQDVASDSGTCLMQRKAKVLQSLGGRKSSGVVIVPCTKSNGTGIAEASLGIGTGGLAGADVTGLLQVSKDVTLAATRKKPLQAWETAASTRASIINRTGFPTWENASHILPIFEPEGPTRLQKPTRFQEGTNRPWVWLLVGLGCVAVLAAFISVGLWAWSSVSRGWAWNTWREHLAENPAPAEFTLQTWEAQRVMSKSSLLSPSKSSILSEEQKADLKEVIEIAEAKGLPDAHLLVLEDLIARLETDTQLGLTTKEAAKRFLRDGPNALKPPKKLHPLLKFAYQLIGGFAPLLWFAAILCGVAYWPLGEPDPASLNLALCLVLIGVIFLQAGFNFYQEYQSDQVMERLAEMLPSSATAIRDGKQQLVDLKALVVGDIVVVGAGEKVPADLRVVSSDGLKIDKSALNGESEPVTCTLDSTDNVFLQTRNVAFFGCNAVEGRGVGIVIATGDDTVFGEIASLVSENEGRPSTLAAEMTRTCKLLACLAIITGGSAFLTWALWLRVRYPQFQNLSQIMVNCITLIVAFVPESMPICVTVTLALIAKEMGENNVLVRNLEVVETLGAVSVIASDKTGTLTQNRMTVSDLSQKSGSQGHARLTKTMALCSRAARASPDDLTGDTIIGDATEVGLMKHYLLCSKESQARSLEEVRQDWPKVAELPFNSRNKFMITIHDDEGGEASAYPQLQAKGRVLLMKGAPEIIMQHCTSFLKDNSSVATLKDSDRKGITDDILEVAGRGRRCLGFAYRTLDTVQMGRDSGFQFDVDTMNFPIDELTFIGWAALRDPPRDGVKDAIGRCHAAHIRVAMVTGDHHATAQAIAREVGIVTSKGVDTAEQLVQSVDGAGFLNQSLRQNDAVVVTGGDLERLGEAGLRQACQYKEIVFARTTPKQKFDIVCMFQSLGECVAVTGDGVNDAPALKQADCGVAMGSGTDVSKEAAALIILDDNFATVVKGIELGRTCFANLKKVIMYLLPAGSFCEALPVLTNVFLGMPLALSDFLMLIISCCTDVSPSLSMVYEKPEKVTMTAPPRNIHKNHLVDLKLIGTAYLFIGVIQASIAYSTFFLYYSLHGIYPGDLLWKFTDNHMQMQSEGQSLYFYALVVSQFGNILTSRTFSVSTFEQNPLWGPTQNRRIFAAICVSACFVGLVLYVPFIQHNLDVSPLPMTHWQPLVLPWVGSAMLVMLNEARKKWIRTFPDGLIASVAVS